jgi:NADPH-dependent glutamate synthase beta subunit-like oxidoreductase
MEEAGGMLQYAIPAYRLPKNYVRDTVSALKNMGIQFVMKTEIGRDILPAKLEDDFDKVFYDIGAWKKSIIGLEGEELTVFGLDFLVEVKDWMEGKLGSDVLVVGGGNVAMDVAVTAKRLGAANVTLVCVEKEEEMPRGRKKSSAAGKKALKSSIPTASKKFFGWRQNQRHGARKMPVRI